MATQAGGGQQVDLDDVILKVGRFGRFQQLLLLTLVLVAVSVGHQNMASVFTLMIPCHHCQLPSIHGNDTYCFQDNLHQQAVNATVPISISGVCDSCNIFPLDSERNNSSSPTPAHSCSSWVYDKSVFERTLVSDLDMVCDRKILRSHSNMMLFAGKILGAILQGFFSDKFGRRRVLIACSLAMLATSVGNCFVSSVAALFVMRFLTGMTTSSSFLAVFILTVEYMRAADRAKASLLFRMSFATGQILLAPLAYLLRDWQKLQLAILWPTVMLLLFLWKIPESARWLMARNKKEQAHRQLLEMAKANGASLSISISDLHFKDAKNSTAKTLPIDLFTDKRLALRWTVVYINWVVVSMAYYGLTLNVSNTIGDIYLDYVLNILADYIGTSTAALLVTKISRKYTHVMAITVSGSACALTFIPVLIGPDDWVIKLLSLVGKMCISSALFVMYTYTPELFPTQYRAFGLGSSSMMGRIGGLLSPYVADLNLYVTGDLGQVMPQLLFGVTAILAGLLAFILPETLNRKLPDTVEECRNFNSKAGQNATPVEKCREESTKL